MLHKFRIFEFDDEDIISKYCESYSDPVDFIRYENIDEPIKLV